MILTNDRHQDRQAMRYENRTVKNLCYTNGYTFVLSRFSVSSYLKHANLYYGVIRIRKSVYHFDIMYCANFRIGNWFDSDWTDTAIREKRKGTPINRAKSAISGSMFIKSSGVPTLSRSLSRYSVFLACTELANIASNRSYVHECVLSILTDSGYWELQ